MRQNKWRFILLFIVFLFAVSKPTFASGVEEVSREEVFSHLQEAFNAQVSLTEKPRTKEEISFILSSFFEDKIIKTYMEKNLQPLEGKFIVYGTDFPFYTIPFFSYDENTVMIQNGNNLLVYEFFSASDDGPVSYDDHYELVKLEKTNEGMKVYEVETYINKIEPILNEMKTNIDPEPEKTGYYDIPPQFISYGSMNKETINFSLHDWTPLYVPYFYFQTKTLLNVTDLL